MISAQLLANRTLLIRSGIVRKAARIAADGERSRKRILKGI